MIKSRVFSLPGRKALLKSQMNYKVVLVDATETPIERPTLKMQLVIDKVSQKVICTNFIHGKRHDFHLFKQSSARFQANTQLLTDSGYQSLQKIHAKEPTAQEKAQETTANKARETSKQDHRQSAGAQREHHG